MSASSAPDIFARLAGAFVLAAVILFAATAGAQVPTFTKSFDPDTIGPGSVSTLTFTITNVGGSVVTDLAFTDALPGAVTLAAAAQGTTTCPDGLVSAPNGGTTISLTDGRLGPGASCTVTVNVTSATAGAHVNTSGDLTSSAGNSGTAVDTLTVSADLPGFSKSFAPNPNALGARGTLTFTINNTAVESFAQNLQFTDALPAGLVIADPANVTNTCFTATFTGGIVTALPGTSVVSLAAGAGNNVAFVEGFSTCAITVDVVATAVGSLGNVSGDLTSDLGNSGKAAATLQVTAADIVLIKAFLGDPISPGGTVDLQFTIQNLSRTTPATNLAFQDDLDAVLSGLSATGSPTPNPPCGAGSSLTGAGLLTFSGGTLAPESSCTFSVPVTVPASAANGGYPNTTTALTGVVGVPVVANQAFDVLFVTSAPTITKSFLVDPVAAGGSTTLEFTITNPETAAFTATDIAFIDELTTFLPFPVSVSLPPVPDPPCGVGSSLTLISLGPDRQGLSLTGGILDPGTACVFTVGIDIPAGLSGSVYVNTTNPITADVGEEPVTGGTATDTLTVLGAPSLVKVFTNDPVAPGGTVTLEFTLTHDAAAPGNATGVTFTDDLAATLTGLTGMGLPLTNLCGPGNGTLSGSAGNTLLTFSGATLTPGQICTFSVTLQVAAGATSGVFPNMTSAVNATVSGLAVVGGQAQDNLIVSALRFTKQFIGDPALPGATLTLRFTLNNTLGTVTATEIAFTDNLNDTLPGLTALAPLPVAPCGGVLSGTSLLSFSGGSVAAGTSCTFDVTVQVPNGAADGDYINTTSSLTASIPPSPEDVVLPPATDTLTVASDVLILTKSFTNDPATPGGTVTLQFNLTNQSTQTVTTITFTDDLGVALAGLTATGLPIPACGGTLSGTSVLTLTGASLPPSSGCIFSVTLSVPAAVSPGTVATNTTSAVTGLIGEAAVSGGPASDDLQIVVLEFSKSFAGPTVPGATVQLTFTIRNLNPSSGVTGITFTDNLGSALAGLAATGLPAFNVCGLGSQLTGTSIITLSDGSLGPGATCTFGVTVQVPAGTTPGTYVNTTSDVFLAGLKASNPASASLIVNAVPVPTFGKGFAPSPIVTGGVSTLTFTIDNSASPLPANNLAFTDNLPAGVVVASPSNASSTCTGGTVTAVPGTGVISYGGGSVAAAATCTVQANVTSLAPGTHVNTSDNLTSSAGNSGPASSSLIVNAVPVPLFTKSFAPANIAAGGVSTLTFTIDNSASPAPATNLTFTDNLPAGVVVATPPNASTTCVGGTLTAAAGASVISYSGGSVAAGSTCVVRVDVTVTAGGTFVNTTQALTSSLGNSGTAGATLVVNADARAIPTLGEVGMLLLGALLALVALRRLRPRPLARRN